MNTAHNRTNRVLRFFAWFAVVVGALCFLVGVGVCSALSLPREAKALRNELLASFGSPLHSRIQLSVGPTTVALVRQIVRQIDDLPPEAAVALNAVHSASVGVLEFRKCDDRSAFATHATAAMRRKGWERVVSVNDSENTVVIYVPRDSSFGDELRVCLAVVHDATCTVVSARIDPEALMPLLREHLKELPARPSESI
jgi:hypothetical protein